MKKKTIVSHSARETERIAADVAKMLRGGEVILLDGDLGAGKTVFVRGLAKGLGVSGRITSPTFVLMRVHEVMKKKTRGLRSATINFLVHVDAYRIHNPQELIDVGLLDWVGRPDTVVAIEWGNLVRGTIGSTRAFDVVVRGTPNDHEQREISVALLTANP